MNQDSTGETVKPAAYDADGKPLYATPEEALRAVGAEKGPGAAHSTHSNQPSHQPHQFVHMVRAIDPTPLDIPEDVKRRHDESSKKFPDLNLSPNEFIVAYMPRHVIGMLGPIVLTTICVALVLSLIFNFPYIAELLNVSTQAYGILMLAGVMLAALFLLGGYAALWVYMNNRFFLTNESVIQEIQTGLFSRKEQTVSLANIEDASYSQIGPIQTIFNYGSIRLSTEGDETTYRFSYVANPKYHIAILNNAVESFKNGRPVGASVEEGVKKMKAQGKSGSAAGAMDDPNDD